MAPCYCYSCARLRIAFPLFADFVVVWFVEQPAPALVRLFQPFLFKWVVARRFQWPSAVNLHGLLRVIRSPLAPRRFKDEFQTPFGLGLNFDLHVSLPCNTSRFPASEFLADSTVLSKPTPIAQASVLGYKTGGCRPSTEFCGLVWALPYKYVLTYL